MKVVLSLFLSVYLFAGSLFPGNSFANFSELPTLLQHYTYHKTIETPGINFFEFLALHYCNAAHEKSDPANHQKLPLHHSTSAFSADKIVSASSFGTLLHVLPGLNTLKPTYKSVFLSSANSLGIFHPPKA